MAEIFVRELHGMYCDEDEEGAVAETWTEDGEISTVWSVSVLDVSCDGMILLQCPLHKITPELRNRIDDLVRRGVKDARQYRNLLEE